MATKFNGVIVETNGGVRTIAGGGTGATTAAGALTALGAQPAGSYATLETATQQAAGLMSSTDKTKLDGIVASDAAGLALGTAAAGTSTNYARADHVHPIPGSVLTYAEVFNNNATTAISTALGTNTGVTLGNWVAVASSQLTLGEASSGVTLNGTAGEIAFPAQSGAVLYEFMATIGCFKSDATGCGLDIGLGIGTAEPTVGMYTTVPSEGLSGTPRELSVSGIFTLPANTASPVRLMARRNGGGSISGNNTLAIRTLNLSIRSCQQIIQGTTSQPNTLSIGTVTTGAAGSSASATISGSAPSQALNLTIPRGDAGTNGTNGTNGKTILSGSGNPGVGTGVEGDFYINTLTNQIFGPKSAGGVWPNGVNLVGPANTLSIGTITTGAAGSSASATVSGTAPSQTLSLTIPRGDTGAAGLRKYGPGVILQNYNQVFQNSNYNLNAAMTNGDFPANGSLLGGWGFFPLGNANFVVNPVDIFGPNAQYRIRAVIRQTGAFNDGLHCVVRRVVIGTGESTIPGLRDFHGASGSGGSGSGVVEIHSRLSDIITTGPTGAWEYYRVYFAAYNGGNGATPQDCTITLEQV